MGVGCVARQCLRFAHVLNVQRLQSLAALSVVLLAQELALPEVDFEGAVPAQCVQGHGLFQQDAS